VRKSEVPVHELEFSSDVTFWTEGDATPRRTWLMPVSTPSEFVAFGAVGPSNTPRFMARGRVKEHLGDFVARMVREGSSVELDLTPPLPGHLVRRQGLGGPHENQVGEKPPPPPINGLLPTDGVAVLTPDSKRLWDGQGDATSRWVLLVPLKDTTEFAALGVLRPSTQVVFAFRGSVKERLADFLEKMTRAEATVELYARPPLPRKLVREYLRNPDGSDAAP